MSETVMAYFDKNKGTELVTDASPFGLSAILTQTASGSVERKVVAYISRSLSDVWLLMPTPGVARNL